MTVIIGSVGSGKTSLLMTILGEVPIVSGKVKVNGRISYASQEPWIFSGTVRQNILFGNDFDEHKYKRVIFVSALEEDIRLLPFGDNTLVGERGVALSGGQRARVNLARALYNEAHCYLLDDPLSAVDSVVAKHIFDECINGYLKNKCVVLVTHQIQFIRDAKHIIVIKDGKCLNVGTYDDLSQTEFDFHETNAKIGKESFTSDEFESKSCEENEIIEDKQRIVEKSTKQTNELESDAKTSAKIYWIYLKSGAGLILLSTLTISNMITQTLFTGSDYWLSQWTHYHQNMDIKKINQNFTFNKSSLIDSNENNNLIIYSSLVSCLFLFSLLRTSLLFTICMRASVNLHNRLFESLIRAKISFFNKTPIGIILNRFSRDLGIIDELLPQTAFETMQTLINCLAISLLCAFIDFWTLIPCFILLILFAFIRHFYIGTALRLKKVEGIK